MHTKHCAAMWEYPTANTEKVRILSHMQKVEPGNLIFMFASGQIIGVGKAAKYCDGPFLPGNARRIGSDEWLGAEWHVRVQWLRWDLDNSCPFPGWNAAFYELKGPTWAERRNKVIKHFDLNER